MIRKYDQRTYAGFSVRHLGEEAECNHEKWAVMVRPSLMRDYARSGVEPSATDARSWFMWRGYLMNDDGRLVHKWLDDGGSRAAHIHTSGHVSPVDLRAFAKSMQPLWLVPIHGVA
jgi:ribonuclease J